MTFVSLKIIVRAPEDGLSSPNRLIIRNGVTEGRRYLGLRVRRSTDPHSNLGATGPVYSAVRLVCSSEECHTQ